MHGLYAELLRARGFDRRTREAIVHLALMENMTQRIHMRMGKTVIPDRIDILGKDVAVVIMHQEAVLKRKLIIGAGLFRQVKGQRNRDTLGHQRSGLTPFLGGNQIERAELIVLSPASPI